MRRLSPLLLVALFACNDTDDSDDQATDSPTDVEDDPTCGDGEVEGDEDCDDGTNDGGEGECLPGCVGLQECGDGAIEGTEQCDDGNDEDDDGCSATCEVEGELVRVELDIPCTVGESEDVTVPTVLTVSTSAPLTAGATLTVNASVVPTITPSIGQLVLFTGEDEVTVSEMTFTLEVTGATTDTMTVTTSSTPFTMDVDIDDDLTADPYALTSDTVSDDLTHDGTSSALEVSLTTVVIALTDVPILETMDLRVPTTDPEALVTCTLPEPNTAATFDLVTD